ncbi:nucleotidyltransferase domain-containing protein [Pasteurella atlantica]|uniref:Nucleotidyltransferase domain-containing protein n=1 Tax=Pasteurella atlantica TaxID=2827233 RepID=A0AAW8CSG0_9PAST|nr:nucleotidyltransferase domain-containing protein [Pasteurella atlantica]MBR0574425.1 nucleotidyltransferase domain-containing protein [Pasteurella atlantica]MDP8032897.1 nucleotidyltransferase domain-containing protein [Pasteurella atlantica]MDP8034946.1 nucleotidyltransferase domain-containing protein [Pasteurella atlantica]MDP8036784.1 nucleotidyltransferase domain-containing protein [Pasteurella atlantica]MDP8040336.1 nucleotidyltransferase domain-containing protein [Pasteurella atlantic
MNNQFGLYEHSYVLLCDALKLFPEIEQAWIFGSRALGNYKKGSDIDLAISGQNINFDTVTALYGTLNEEISIPYMVDVVDINNIENPLLKEHIEQKGVLFYSRGV